MAWNSRLEFLENTYYHVYNLWLASENIFLSEEYFDKFHSLLIKYFDLYPELDLLSYSIVPNAFHLVVYNKKTSHQLSELMKRLSWAYAVWFRIRNPSEFKKPVFASRFRSKLLKKETDLLKTVSFVNFLPLKKGIIDDIWDYDYTSYHLLENHPMKEDIDFYKDLWEDFLDF